MGLLKKKIPGATLMETLVATSIILIVFVVASLVLNNTFRTWAEKDSFSLQNRLEVLQYLYVHKKLTVPYYEDFEGYEIAIESALEDTIEVITYTAIKEGQKTPVIVYTIDETAP